MNDTRQHFSAALWVDLARGQLQGPSAGEMDMHLRSGCRTCMAEFDTWQDFVLFAREERSARPPDASVRVAKSLLAQRRLAHPPAPASHPILHWASAALATLIHDSRAAGAAGVRAGATLSRHLAFRANDLIVDLRIDSADAAGRFRITGQVADSRYPDQPPGQVQLSLVNDAAAANDDDEALASTLATGPLGEFCFMLHAGSTHRLLVHADQQRIVAIPLAGLVDALTETTRLRTL